MIDQADDIGDECGCQCGLLSAPGIGEYARAILGDTSGKPIEHPPSRFDHRPQLLVRLGKLSGQQVVTLE